MIRKAHSHLGPPKANGEANVQRAHMMPAAGWDVQHVTWVQDTLHTRGLGEQRELLQVRAFNVHLDGAMFT